MNVARRLLLVLVIIVGLWLLCWQSSLADLNTRMPEPLPMNRFRPNLVIDDSVEPWAEDDWQELTVVGPPDRKVEFVSLKPCSRCKARRVSPALLSRAAVLSA